MAKKIILALWIILLVVIQSVAIYLFVLVNDDDLPDTTDLENIDYKFASQVISSDGKELGTWSLRQENRVFVDFDSISPHMINALLATEDVRFYEHPGIDLKASFRALIKTGLLQQENSGGGSTITQQLAKLVFTENASTEVFDRIGQKAKEHVIAIRLEKQYTKMR
jgi:penicillin-binding protein 1A